MTDVSGGRPPSVTLKWHSGYPGAQILHAITGRGTVAGMPLLIFLLGGFFTLEFFPERSKDPPPFLTAFTFIAVVLWVNAFSSVLAWTIFVDPSWLDHFSPLERVVFGLIAWVAIFVCLTAALTIRGRHILLLQQVHDETAAEQVRRRRSLLIYMLGTALIPCALAAWTRHRY